MDWGSSWDFLWHFLIIFAWIAYLLVLFQILVDLFWRDHQTSGWVKAVWVFFPDPVSLAHRTDLLGRPRQRYGTTRAGCGRQCEEGDGRLHPGGRRPVTGAGNRRRQSAFGCRHNHTGRVRIAEGQVA